MSYAAVAAAGIGAAGSIGSSLIGKSGSKKAGKAQRFGDAFAAIRLKQARDVISGQLEEGYDRATSELEPYAQGGNEAFAQLLYGLGIAGAESIGRTAGGIEFGNLIREFGEDDFKTDPGYQFALSEGQKGIDRRFASRGLNKSGAVMKALNRFNTGLANQQYGNAWERYGREQDRKLRGLGGVAQEGSTTATKLAGLHTSHASAQAANTQEEALNRAALIQSFFGSQAQQSANRANIGMATTGNLANIGQGLVGSLFGSGGGLSAVGNAPDPFSTIANKALSG